MRKIILSGYMGCGKTTIATELALKTGLPNIDLDHNIEGISHMPVNEIFHKKGELFFRKTEHNALMKIMQIGKPFILSLGGGTPCYFDNMKLLHGADIISFYLQASIDTLYYRLRSSEINRPLIMNIPDADLKQFIGKHLFERNFYYTQATHTINTDGRTPGTIAEEIISKLV